MLPTMAQIAMSCAAQSAAHAAASQVPKECRGQIHSDVMQTLIESRSGMFEHDIAVKLDVTRQRVTAALQVLKEQRLVTRRKGARRRDDGQGFRNSWKYRATIKENT